MCFNNMPYPVGDSNLQDEQGLRLIRWGLRLHYEDGPTSANAIDGIDVGDRELLQKEPLNLCVCVWGGCYPDLACGCCRDAGILGAVMEGSYLACGFDVEGTTKGPPTHLS